MKNIILLFLLSATYLWSDPLQVGEELSLLQYETQRDEKVTIPTGTRTLVFTSEMEASKIAHEVFEIGGEDYLNQNSTIFISDIHKMPFLISKFVALPKMRKYKYTMHLIKEDGVGSGKLTVISLSNFKITSIQYVGSADELKKQIEKK